MERAAIFEAGSTCQPSGWRGQTMFWMIFGIGLLMGTVIGIVVVALCQTAASARRRLELDRQQGCRFGALRTPALGEHPDENPVFGSGIRC
jgi:heme/copper-type cytochrome/quinol oxidase subunit 2